MQALENTLKHQLVLSQKTLGENLLQMMPTAVVTVDAEGFVTWSNAPADVLFPALARGLGSRERRNIRPPPGARSRSRNWAASSPDWCATPSRAKRWPRRNFSESRAGGRQDARRAHAPAFSNAGKCLGAVALVDDITEQLNADVQQEQIDRARFWRELAASRQPRNP